MNQWLRVLAIVFLLGAGAMLSACGPPDDIDEEELEEAMEEGMDEGSLEDNAEEDMGDGMEDDGGGDFE